MAKCLPDAGGGSLGPLWALDLLEPAAAEQDQDRGHDQVEDRHDQKRPAWVQAERHQAVTQRDGDQDDREQGEERCGSQHAGAGAGASGAFAQLRLGEL